MLKIICMTNFHVVEFLWFRLIHKIFLKNGWRLQYGERLESFYRLVYYQVSGDPRITGCSNWLDIYPWGCGLTRTSLFIDCCRVSLNFCVLKFRGWSRPRNYVISEIFPIYSTCFKGDVVHWLFMKYFHEAFMRTSGWQAWFCATWLVGTCNYTKWNSPGHRVFLREDNKVSLALVTRVEWKILRVVDIKQRQCLNSTTDQMKTD